MTSSEASTRDARLTAIEEKLEALLKEKNAKSRKNSSADQAKELLQEHALCLAGLKAELSSLKGSDKKLFKSAHTKHEEAGDKYRNEFGWKQLAEKKDARGALLDGASDSKKPTETMTADELMAHGLSVQKSSTESLRNSVSVMHQTLAMGKETAAKLDEQTDQLRRINNTNNEIGARMDRSIRITKQIRRAM